MCLSTGIKKLVAQRDITCYKVLKTNGNKYLTPYRNTKVELNKELVADEPEYDYGERNSYSIGTGYIHALLCFNVDDLSCDFGDGAMAFKAIIPAGTEFFIDGNLSQICARKMFITDEKMKESVSRNNAPEWLSESMTSQGAYAESVNGVYVGDFCVAQEDGSKKYIRPLEYTDEIDKDIIGVVGFFKDGKPVVISRNDKYEAWCNIPWGSRPLINKDVDYDDTAEQMNGEELTVNVLKHKSYTKDNYPAFDYISHFKTKGTKEGDWYIGAIGELRKLANFTALLNVSLGMLEGADLLDFWLWSSSEYDSDNAWSLLPSDGYVRISIKYNSLRVRAFAVFAVAKD